MQCALAAARAASTKTPSHSFEREGGADPVQIESSPSRARHELRVATVETAEPDAARRDVERAREHDGAIGAMPPGVSGICRLARVRHAVNDFVQIAHARSSIAVDYVTTS
jgi:hypothetical protein